MTSATFKAGLNRVTFKSSGELMHGHLFLPEQTDPSLPLILVTGSWTTVKEQMPDRYAQRLTREGFATLTFDFRFYGESGGEPRQYEVPDEKVKDILGALDFVGTLPMVDQTRIGALAICASSGYVAHALSGNHRIKAFVVVAPWLHNSQLVGTVYGGDKGVKQRIQAGENARKQYETTGKVEYIPAASRDDEAAAMYGPFDYYLDPTRGAIPEWENRLAVMSWAQWLTFDAIEAAPLVRVPTLIVHSEEAAIPDGVKAFYHNLKAPKDILWTAGTQFDFYDQEPQVSKSVSAAVSHFRLTL